MVVMIRLLSNVIVEFMRVMHQLGNLILLVMVGRFIYSFLLMYLVFMCVFLLNLLLVVLIFVVVLLRVMVVLLRVVMVLNGGSVKL